MLHVNTISPFTFNRTKFQSLISDSATECPSDVNTDSKPSNRDVRCFTTPQASYGPYSSITLEFFGIFRANLSVFNCQISSIIRFVFINFVSNDHRGNTKPVIPSSGSMNFLVGFYFLGLGFGDIRSDASFVPLFLIYNYNISLLVYTILYLHYETESTYSSTVRHKNGYPKYRYLVYIRIQILTY